MKQNKVITIGDLLEVFAAICKRGARPITIHMETDAKLLQKSRVDKTPNTFGSVRKRSLVNGFLNFDYENSVNRQQVREGNAGTFQVKPNWFTHWNGDPRPVVRHAQDLSALYLQVKTEKAIVSTFHGENGEIKKSDLINLLPIKSAPKNQGTEKPILTFTVAFDSILSFTCDEVHYTVAAEKDVPQIAKVAVLEIA